MTQTGMQEWQGVGRGGGRGGSYLSEDHASQGVLVGSLLVALLGLQEAIPLACMRTQVPIVSLHSHKAFAGITCSG